MPTDQISESTTDPTQYDAQEQSESTETQENSPLDNQAAAPQTSDIDWRKLYNDAIQQNRIAEERFNQMQQQLNSVQKQQQAEPELTDADIERFGTVPTIKKIVAKTIREELGETLGDLRTINSDYKRGQMLQSAEAQFFSQNPQLAAHKDVLSTNVRGLIQQTNADPSMYPVLAYAAYGQLQASGALQSTTQTTVTATPRSGPPVSNGRPPAANPAPRLSELERRGMRMVGLNPDDRKDIETYQAMVNADDGISMER